MTKIKTKRVEQARDEMVNALRSEVRVARASEAISQSKLPGKKKTLPVNPYLCTLLDPEGCPGEKYPDQYARKTATFQGLLNYNVPYNLQTASGVTLNEQNGDFLQIFSPVMQHPVLSYQLDNARGGLRMVVQQQTDQYGLFPTTLDTPSVSDYADVMVAGPAFQNIIGQWFWDDQNFSMPGFTGFLTDGSSFSGFPFQQPASITSGIGVQFEVGAQIGTGDTFVVQLVGVNGPYGTPPTVVASNTITITTNNVAGTFLNTAFTGQFGGGRPGLGFRIQYNNNNSTTSNFTTVPLQSITVNCIMAAANTTVTPQFRFDPVDLPDQTTYSNSVDQYRVVSASVWCEYEGSDLNNGGQMAGIMYEGGNSPMENGLFTYSKVSETPGGYQQALRFGLYSFWLPANDNDMLFRRLNSSSRWSHPYIVWTGVVATPTQVNALRARIPINYEIVSTSQFYDYKSSPTSPKLIEDAVKRLRGVPTSMENPSHWDTIKSIVSGVGNAVNGAISAAKFVAPAVSSLMDFAKLVGGVMMV